MIIILIAILELFKTFPGQGFKDFKNTSDDS